MNSNDEILAQYQARILELEQQNQKLSHDILKSEEQFTSVVRELPYFIYQLDRQKRLIFANQAFLDFYDTTLDKIRGLTSMDFYDEEIARKFTADDELVMSQDQRFYDIEKNVDPASGKVHFVEVIKTPMHNEKGEVIGLQGLFWDITERQKKEEEHRRLELQLQQAFRFESLGRAAGGIAHDFNNMLTAILGFSELALMIAPPDAKLRGYLKEITSISEQSTKWTQELLQFARQALPKPLRLDLNQEVQTNLGLLTQMVGGKITIQWTPGLNLWSVKMDPNQFNRVLINFAVNARDALKGTGVISLRTENFLCTPQFCMTHPMAKEGSFVAFFFRDEGSGMDAHTLKNCFEPFFTTKGAFQGTGLGLATIYNAVNQGGGFVLVESELGKGTEFGVYLPKFN